MDFAVQQTLIIDSEKTINKGDLIKITTISQEVMQGEFISANDFQEEISIFRRDIEWVFNFDEIEEIEVIEKN